MAKDYTFIIGINPSTTVLYRRINPHAPGHTIVALKNPAGKLEKVFSYGPQRHGGAIACSWPGQTDYALVKNDEYKLYEWPINQYQFENALSKMREIE